MIVGTEWLVDATGCDSDALRDPNVLRSLFGRIMTELELIAVGEPTWHRFPSPGGITGIVLLTESHLACHTYPEYGIATFNLYCCRTRPDWPWEERLRDALSATRVIVRVVERDTGDLHINHDSQNYITELRGKQ
jgi:S-adenosylmethionine decarboxylase